MLTPAMRSVVIKATVQAILPESGKLGSLLTAEPTALIRVAGISRNRVDAPEIASTPLMIAPIAVALLREQAAAQPVLV
jgi:hypothetical protein